MEQVKVEGSQWKRRSVLGMLAAVVPAVALVEMAEASPNFPRGAKCQHSHQCASGCCGTPKNSDDGTCRKHKFCRKHPGREKS